MLVPLTSDAAYSLLHDAGWKIGDTTYADPDSGRLVWMVYAHRGEQKIVARAESQAAAWNEAVRLTTEIEGEAAEGAVR